MDGLSQPNDGEAMTKVNEDKLVTYLAHGRPKRPSGKIVNLRLRLPETLHNRLKQQAKDNLRSLNGEIVYRLAEL